MASRNLSRAASHAGSWYTDDGDELQEQLQKWLDDVKIDINALQPARAVICPHAGYSYSGPTAAYSFKHLAHEPTAAQIRRVFILGPSHHHYTKACELTKTSVYETPVGNLKIDTAVIAELNKSGLFGKMDLEVDEAEHSIEMQLPFLAYVMQGRDFTVVPILVGDLSFDAEAKFGQLLAPYFEDPSNFFVISSDFCHWGKRFDFTFYDKSKGAIWQSIEALDKEGCALIEQQSAPKFFEYLKAYHNTICGRHPIGVLLQILAACRTKFQVKFVHYAQSSQCQKGSDSSVSYCAAVVASK